MEIIGVRELRQHASRYLDRVKEGESIEVTQRGVPVAMLVPVVRDDGRGRLILEGRLTPRRGPRVLPVPVAVETPSTDTLDELRAERE